MEAGEEVICLNNYFTGHKSVIDFAREPLNWQPTVSLEQGWDPTTDSFRKVLALGDQPGA